jgi:hypothetical protein
MYTVYRKHPDGRGHVYLLGTFDTVRELFNTFRIGDLSGDPDRRWYGGWSEGWGYLAYVVNDNNVILSDETLLGLYRSVKSVYRYFNGWKRSHAHYYRHPRTTQEKRVIVGVVKEDGEPEFRPARKHVPDAWEDQRFFCRRINNWKRYRQHQWK